MKVALRLASVAFLLLLAAGQARADTFVIDFDDFGLANGSPIVSPDDSNPFFTMTFRSLMDSPDGPYEEPLYYEGAGYGGAQGIARTAPWPDEVTAPWGSVIFEAKGDAVLTLTGFTLSNLIGHYSVGQNYWIILDNEDPMTAFNAPYSFPVNGVDQIGPMGFSGHTIEIEWGDDGWGVGISDIRLTAVSPTATPEPGTLATLSIGLLGLGLLRKRIGLQSTL